jgi:phage terminase small subunit
VLAMLTYEDAQEQVNHDGAVIEAPKTKVRYQHPALSIANKQGQIIAKLEADLGITVMKRAAASKGKVVGKRSVKGCGGVEL